MRIIVRSANWLGDAVMATPALMRLREWKPAAHITLLTRDHLAPLWTGHPAVNDVMGISKSEGLWSVARRIRARHFDLGVGFPNSDRAALELYLGGVPIRAGYAGIPRSVWLNRRVPQPEGLPPMRKKSAGEIRRQVREGGTTAPAPPARLHHMHHYLRLVAALGARSDPMPPRIVVAPSEIEAMERRLGGAHGAWHFGVNPGAEYGPAKRWPVERFVEAVHRVQQRVPIRPVIFGGPGDVDICNAIETALGRSMTSGHAPAPINLGGRTTLRELCAGLKLCRVVLTNDTGPMHLAAALGTPVIAVFGSTDPVLTGPGLPGDGRHRMLTANAPCAPCFLRRCPIDFRCMTEVGVDRVARAAFELLESVG